MIHHLNHFSYHDDLLDDIVIYPPPGIHHMRDFKVEYDLNTGFITQLRWNKELGSKGYVDSTEQLRTDMNEAFEDAHAYQPPRAQGNTLKELFDKQSARDSITPSLHSVHNRKKK